MKKLFLPSKITTRQSKEKIYCYAKFSKHQHPRPSTNADVSKLLGSLKYDEVEFIEYCRDFRKPIPNFENLLRSRWKGYGNWSVVDRDTSEELFSIKGEGELSLSPYEPHLEDAFAARDKAINTSSMREMEIMATHGIAAFEAFFAILARRWNKNHPENPLLDSKKQKTSLENKIDTWLPQMFPNAKIPKDDRCRSDFHKMMKIRDTMQHPKSNTLGHSIDQVMEGINAYKHGVSLYLIRIHIAAICYIPSILINSFYFPDVQIGEDTGKQLKKSVKA
jgi:hypothetical protein